MSRVTVIGTGYVGLVTGVCLADSGHDTVCVDLDEEKVARLSAGESTIYEPGIEELLAKGLSSGRLSFATPGQDWPDLLSEVVFIAVGTPMSDNGAADLSQVRSAVSSVCEHAREPLVLVMKSTVPPGTGAHLVDRFVRPCPQQIDYVSNPEFLREGHAIEDWYETDRIVLGGEREAISKVRALYEGIDATVVETDTASAEMIKYASNAFLTTKISFINEIANVCDCVGANIDDVALGVGLDMRISPHFLHAGIGYGGSCFPKDTRALDFVSTLSGYQFDLLKAVIDVNNRQRLLPLVRLKQAVGSLVGLRVAVLGLTFKPQTDDTRESPARDIIPLLAEEGAVVSAYDPVAPPESFPDVERAATVWDALEGAAMVVLVTEWDEFRTLDWDRAAALMSRPGIVFDGRNALDARSICDAGLEYMAVGRPGAHRD